MALVDNEVGDWFDTVRMPRMFSNFKLTWDAHLSKSFSIEERLRKEKEIF